MEIIPSILVKDRREFDEKISEVEKFAGKFHLDIADGIFVSNTTIGPEVLDDFNSGLEFEVHLMVQKPENHISRWVESGANKFIIHAEATDKIEQVVNVVKEAGFTIGVALNPTTPIDRIKRHMDEIDLVHFMTVEPGFYGSAFVPEVIEKIKDLHYFYPDILIEADGGISPDNIKSLAEAGASIFVVGSYIWNNKDKQKAIEELKQ